MIFFLLKNLLIDFSFLYLKLKDFPYQVGSDPATRKDVFPQSCPCVITTDKEKMGTKKMGTVPIFCCSVLKLRMSSFLKKWGLAPFSPIPRDRKVWPWLEASQIPWWVRAQAGWWKNRMEGWAGRLPWPKGEESGAWNRAAFDSPGQKRRVFEPPCLSSNFVSITENGILTPWLTQLTKEGKML